MKSILSLVFLLVFTCSAQAQGALQGGPQKRGFLGDLDLEPEQIEKLRELRGSGAQMRGGMSELREKREKLMKLVRDPNASDDQIRAAANEMAEQRVQMERQRIDKLLQLRHVLSPEQLGRVLDKIKERMRGRLEGRGSNSEAGEGILSERMRGRGLRLFGQRDGN